MFDALVLLMFFLVRPLDRDKAKQPMLITVGFDGLRAVS